MSLRRVKGNGELSAKDEAIRVNFVYDVFPSGSMFEIRGQVFSEDFKTLFAWHQSATKLTLTTENFSLALYLTDDHGGFTATGGPLYCKQDG
jgi:hypothetical protein